MRKPRIKRLTFHVEATRGSMFLADAAPKGYTIQKIERKGNKATATYVEIMDK